MGKKSMNSVGENTALILIDVQAGFEDPVWGPRNNPEAEANMARLLAAWRAADRPIYHVQHMSTEPASPLRPGQLGNDFMDAVRPLAGEPVIQKNVNSAFIGTDLDARLRDAGIDDLVVVGLTTNHCVSTTVRMAGNLGFRTRVVADATAAFDRIGPDGTRYPAEQIHAISLANLHGEFAQVVKTKDLL